MLSHSLTSPNCGYTHDSLRGKVPKFHVVPPIFPIILFQARWSKPVTTQAGAEPSGHISSDRSALQIDFGLELQYIYFFLFSILRCLAEQGTEYLWKAKEMSASE